MGRLVVEPVAGRKHNIVVRGVYLALGEPDKALDAAGRALEIERDRLEPGGPDERVTELARLVERARSAGVEHGGQG